MGFSGKIKISVGDKNIGQVDISKELSNEEVEEMMWKALLVGEPIIFKKGQDVSLNLDGLTRRFHVNRTFAFHGTQKNETYITVSISLETMKGLGIISKLKGEKK